MDPHLQSTLEDDLRPEKAPATIGFRLDETSRQALGRQAKRLGVSPHELARFYVLELLSANEERQALRDTLEMVYHQNDCFRRSMALAVEALLTASGKLSPQQAKEWSAANFNFD